MSILLENTVDTNSRHVGGNLDVTGCPCASQAVAGASQPSAENGIQEDPSQKPAALNSWVEHILKCFHSMVDPIHQEPNTLFVCIDQRLHIWNSRTSGASRHQSTRELPLEQRPNYHHASRRSHLKTYRPVEALIYHNCVELASFDGKGSVQQKWSF